MVEFIDVFNIDILQVSCERHQKRYSCLKMYQENDDVSFWTVSISKADDDVGDVMSIRKKS
jgi:hypothetical protein